MKLKLFILLLFVAAGRSVFAQQAFPFQNEIKAFKKQDSTDFPKPGGILFIGSSSIRMWTDLQDRFPGKPIIRRGVGGCELEDWVKYYTPYVLFPYKPSKIFIYAGENDITNGHSAQTVFADFRQLYSMIREKLPQAKIYFMSIKPGPARFKYWPQMQEANRLIKDFLADKPGTYFLDVSTPIFNARGTAPDSSLFRPDYIHLNAKGYDKWQQVLSPYL